MKSNNPNTIQEAYRYFANAKKTLGKSPVEYGIYTDSKYVSEAAGIAYLSVLKTINTFLIERGMSETALPDSIEEYRDAIRKQIPHNGKLKAALSIVYYNLHILAYYRGGTDFKMVKSGLENCKKIIEMIEKSLGRPLMTISEPTVKYRIKKSKKI